MIALIAAMVAAFFMLGATGATQAAHNQRVLSVLDPLIELIRRHGQASAIWLWANKTVVGWTVTEAAAALALLGLVVGGRRAAPVILLGAGVSLVTWGQILLLADRIQLGSWLYGCGVVCAVALGAWCPMPQLGGFRRLPLPSDDRDQAHRTPASRRGWECLLVFVLTLVALLSRMYALTEIPPSFDGELMDYQILSRTLFGFHEYMKGGAFLTNGAGALTQLTQMGLFRVFGTSIYTLRLTAVLWGVTAVPLSYWLARRLAGVPAGIVAALLVIAAPEQLFWSRTEDTHFPAITVLALITAYLGLWMVERFSIGAVLATALWMPFCRYFYTPGMIMVTYPLILCGHAFVFVRGAWRKAWYVVPVLVGGLALWIFSLSVVYSYLNDWQWRFVHPALAHGAPAWTKHGEFRGVSLSELIRLESTLILSNSSSVLKAVTYDGPFMFSHFYVRAQASGTHRILMNAGCTVMFMLGLGYLLGQFRERRAFALLIWVVIGLLPGVMSNDPSSRRISLMFPAVYPIVALMLVAAVRLIRDRAGRVLAWIATVALSAVVAAVVLTSLASHFLIGMSPVVYEDAIRFARPLFDDGNLILHNFEPGGLGRMVLFGNLDSFLNAAPCYHQVGAKEWRDAALRPRCDFAEYPFRYTMPPERVEAVRQAYHPERVSYLLEDNSSSRPETELLQRLYPSAEVRRKRSRVDQRDFISITLPISEVEALHTPAVAGGFASDGTRVAATGWLRDVRLTTVAATDTDAASQEVVLRGGLLLESDGWYRFQIAPACPEATLKLDEQPSSATDAHPMLAGVHPFEISLPSPAACRFPLQVLASSSDDAAMAALDPSLFVSPHVASLPGAQAPPVVPYDGYGEAKVFARFPPEVIDAGVDAEGNVSVLLWERRGEQSSWRVQRLTPDGRPEKSWSPQVPPGQAAFAMLVEPSGSSIMTFQHTVHLYDRDGNRMGAWESPWDTSTSDIAVWRDGRILISYPSLNTIGVFARNGRLQREFRKFAGGPGGFYLPRALAASAEGDLVVVQDDGQAVVFRNPDEEWNPTFVRTFRVDFGNLPMTPRGCVFDGPGRLLVADPSSPMPLVYNLEGQRLMAAARARDLSTKGMGPFHFFRLTGDRLYAVDRFANALWSISR